MGRPVRRRRRSRGVLRRRPRRRRLLHLPGRPCPTAKRSRHPAGTATRTATGQPQWTASSNRRCALITQCCPRSLGPARATSPEVALDHYQRAAHHRHIWAPDPDPSDLATPCPASAPPTSRHAVSSPSSSTSLEPSQARDCLAAGPEHDSLDLLSALTCQLGRWFHNVSIRLRRRDSSSRWAAASASTFAAPVVVSARRTTR
jgi:hypothetical protein